ncbi:thrombopoietin receptor [Microcaecilia unicolor]|uniref:Thrombopoietin receptor n=1 Tax=Microcaecilia unicolor TaxID=1415580 RepID=A0A6P7YEA1_9AMPH|nr:thrombopoietin receptor [Microcaecilia unicolor]
MLDIDVGSQTAYALRDLEPGVLYYICLRSKPNEVSLSGFWGPWSETVIIVPPMSSDKISLLCFTSDLRKVICEWKRDTENPDVQHALFYKQIDLVWQRCGVWNKSQNGSSLHNWKNHQDESLHTCAFRPENDSKIYVIVNITTASHLVLTYIKEPFLLQHIVRSEPLKVRKMEVFGSSLHLEWEPPLLELSGHMMYEIRYREENETEWKTLQIQHRAHSEILDLRMGTTYSLQIRTKPNGEKFQGLWSTWTDNMQVTVPARTDNKQVTVPANTVALHHHPYFRYRQISYIFIYKDRTQTWKDGSFGEEVFSQPQP